MLNAVPALFMIAAALAVIWARPDWPSGTASRLGRGSFLFVGTAGPPVCPAVVATVAGTDTARSTCPTGLPLSGLE
jgi:hypothetical protein